MYPHVLQFETRELQLQRELQLTREHKRAADRGKLGSANIRELQRQSPPLHLALRRQAVGR